MLQKGTASIRMLVYGSAADSIDEYIHIGESTAMLCLEQFCLGLESCFGAEYLRNSTVADLTKILARSEKRGFPGIVGSIECCEWKWKNCPTILHGHYQGKEEVPMVILEAIADETLLIWHAFFGMQGSANDINVLEASTLSNKIADESYPPPIQYKIAGMQRSIPYCPADGIYTKWPMFVQTVSHPTTEKENVMSQSQEASRKDVERAFGVLQARWHILSRPSHLWRKDCMQTIVNACIILHNMMVEKSLNGMDEDLDLDQGTIVGDGARPVYVLYSTIIRATTRPVPLAGSIAALCATNTFMNNELECFKSRNLVMDHLWARHGTSQLF